MVNFPAPVGGTPFSSDFAPSVLFAILYALLVPFMLYRMLHRRSRTLLLIGTVTFSVERVVIYSLRALQSRNEKERLANGLVTYMQISFGLGFIGIANDLVNIIRCALVNPTFGSEMYFQSPAASTKGGIYAPPPPGTPDQPKLRKYCRDITGFLGLAFLAATVPGIIAQTNYSSALNDQSKADKTQRLRLISSIIALFLCIVLIALVGWSARRFPNNSKRAAAVVTGVSTLMGIVAIYRASVMHVRTTSLLAPNPLNKPSAKAAFYIFHSAPEWLAIALLFYVNVRKLFGTGLAGDYRWKDMSEKEKAKWEKKQAKKEAKKSRKEGLNGSGGGLVQDSIPLGEKGNAGFQNGHHNAEGLIV